MPLQLNDKQALIIAARNAGKPVAFLVGAPLSVDSGGGVPGVQEMVDIVRAQIAGRIPSELANFEKEIAGKAGGLLYQAAMAWLGARLLPDAVNRVVEEGVLKARLPGTPVEFEDIGELSDWYLSSGTRQLGQLVATNSLQFPGPILTTNFDPLLSVAVEVSTGRARWHVVDADGSIGRSAERRRGYSDVVHLHGYWRGSDTLHTPTHLMAGRPALTLSLQSLLRQRTLIVCAYGGWDDVFTEALENLLKYGAPEDRMAINVLWCFRETNAVEVEIRYRDLLKRMSSVRFLAYGGIDCHSIFGEIGGFSDSAGDVPRSVGPSSPLAGWERIDSDYLTALPAVTDAELVKFFDGAIPTWRHAVTELIPRRKVAAQISSRLATFTPGRFGCSLQLIRAAGGEGKTTLLLQTAVDAINTGDWIVLWRPSPLVGLPPEHILSLDTDKRWLIVADEAENLVEDLSECARRLHEAGRSNVHFLVAARDADWLAKFGDKPPWESWLSVWVRRKGALMLRGVTRDDAEAIVKAWTRCGAEGLRELAHLSTLDERVESFVNEVRVADSDEAARGGRRQTFDGSFFGGLLSVRFGQSGLQAHVHEFLNRLREISIRKGSGNLFDALVYVAACHSVGIPGLSENILADLVDVPREWVHREVLQRLGEEAAAVHSGSQVFTRHWKVAAAIVTEADRIADLAEFWKALVRQTVKTGRELRLLNFPMMIYAGPRLVGQLPKSIPKGRREEIAIAAAAASVAENPSWLGCLISLGKTYRIAGRTTDAIKMFREHLPVAVDKTDFAEHIRGYYHEWGTSEGLLVDELRHRASDAWVHGLALGDQFDSARITQENVDLICGGLGVAFGRLAQGTQQFPFAHARRAAAYIGNATTTDKRARGYFERYDHELDDSGTPRPKSLDEALAWLLAGVSQAGREVKDPVLRTLCNPDNVSFSTLRRFVETSRDQGALQLYQAGAAVQDFIPTGAWLADVGEKQNLPGETGVSLVEGVRSENSKDTLRLEVFRVISEWIEQSLLRQRPLSLPAVGKLLAYRFAEHKPVYTALGFRELTGLILSFDEFAVTGEHPRWLVTFREQSPATAATGLRYEVWSVLRSLIDKSAFEGRPLYMAVAGLELARRFPQHTPVQQALGSATLTDLINSFDDLQVVSRHPHVTVAYRHNQPTGSIADLRSEVAAFIDHQLALQVATNTPLLLVVLGVRLARRFPDAKPIHKSLGFGTLTDLILSFNEFTVGGKHPRWVVEHKQDLPVADVEDLRYEVWTTISDLIDRNQQLQVPLHLTTVGLALGERFAEYRPIYRHLGFSTLTDLILSYSELAVTGEHPRWFVQYRDDEVLVP